MADIALQDDWVAVLVDPARGGVISHLGASEDPASNMLASFDWATPLPASSGAGYGDSTMDWLSDFRGGWHLLTPNAGAECVIDGVVQPCNGEVSRATWEVVDVTRDRVTMRTGTRGPLVVTRTVALDGAGVRVRTELTNDTTVPAPAILTEHIVFAAGDDAVVSAPSSARWRVEPDGWRNGAPELTWPEAGLDARPVPTDERVAGLTTAADGWIELHRAGRAVRVEWDPGQLPHLWHWDNRGAERFPWFGRADVIGLEPSSVPRADGLAAARDRGEAWTIPPGATRVVDVAARMPKLECIASNFDRPDSDHDLS